MNDISKKNMLWNAFGNIVYLGLQWVVTVMVTRISGYNDAGVLSLAMSISATFQTIALFGIRSYQVSDVNGKFSDSEYVSFRIVSCLSAMLICMIFSVLNGYSVYQIVSILLFMLFRLAENFSDVLHGIAQNNERLDIAGKAFTIKGTVTSVMFFAGYLCFDSLNAGLMFMALASWGTTLLYDAAQIKKLTDIRLCPIDSVLPMAAVTAPLCAYMFLNSAISTVPKYILEKMCDSESLGAYSSIFAPALLITAAAGYIYNPFAGKFAELYSKRDSKGFISLATRLCTVIAVIAAVILICAYFAGEFALKLIFGEKIAEYVYLLVPILFCTFATTYFAFFGMLETVVRDFRNLIIGSAAGTLICCCFTPLAIEHFGINGASFGMISGGAVGTIYLSAALIIRLRKTEKIEVDM
ncbi:MAG: lipopolysaccharide biosynthesis protein [Oscillospiraceae bacterium]|nr:lipopolysaccharide biosynthesis protein [Oscillospiraceae bacterium]